MTDLRKAAEMALEFIVLSSKDRAWFTEKEFEVVAVLRQALAQPKFELPEDIDAYERGFIDGMQKQMQSTVEKAVNSLAQPKQESEWIEDGFGTMWQKCGKKDCGKFVVKIGKVDCWNGDCPESKENT